MWVLYYWLDDCWRFTWWWQQRQRGILTYCSHGVAVAVGVAVGAAQPKWRQFCVDDGSLLEIVFFCDQSCFCRLSVSDWFWLRTDVCALGQEISWAIVMCILLSWFHFNCFRTRHAANTQATLANCYWRVVYKLLLLGRQRMYCRLRQS